MTAPRSLLCLLLLLLLFSVTDIFAVPLDGACFDDSSVPAKRRPENDAEIRSNYLEALKARKERSELRAFLAFLRAAKLGHPESMYQVARCYEYGLGIGANSDDAITWYNHAADAGHGEAKKVLDRLGNSYKYKNVNNHEFKLALQASNFCNYDKAFYHYMRSARQNCVQGMYQVARCYEIGQGVAANEALALEWYQRAADAGSREAQNDLDKLRKSQDNRKKTAHQQPVSRRNAKKNAMTPDESLRAGERCYREKQYDKAMEYFRMAAEGGNASAQYRIGESYYHGRDCPVNRAEGLAWLHKAADQGHALALSRLKQYESDAVAQAAAVARAQENARLAAEKKQVHAWYCQGLQMDAAGDRNSAVAYLKRAAACGHEGAKNKLLDYEQESIADRLKKAETLYQAGCRAASYKDEVKAYNLYKEAAEQGHAKAQFQLGVCCQQGTGCPQSFFMAREWYSKAAAQGNADAQCALGALCYDSKYGAKNFNEAVKWFHKAAEQGHAEGNYRLALCYYDGMGAEQDFEKAAKLFSLAAHNGYVPAQYRLGLLFLDGEGVTQDTQKAVSLFESAARQGHAQAQYELGGCYLLGKGVTKNKAEMVKWFRKSAEQGYADAQYALGRCYSSGTVVPQDGAESIFWYRQAARQGNEDARAALIESGAL